ncbi:MAG TPA: YkvA family protein [Erysipelotrichaceae bacterium]|nr:YkvA family protein [Erysipelotrichaceae bacterium]
MFNLKENAKTIKKMIPALWFAMKKKETPILAKLFAILTLGYALSPIDLIPDFIPVIGYLDDLILLPLMIFVTIKLIPKHILDQAILESEGMWDKLPKMNWFIIVILLFWGLILYLIFM